MTTTYSAKEFNYDTELYVNYYTWLADHNQIPKYYKIYLEHVLDHKKMVYLAWLYVGDTLHELGFINENDMSDIYDLIINHDNSKLEREEFVPYAKRFNGPRQKNQVIKANFKAAVKLHKDRNIHHYEVLKSYSGRKWKHYAIELICDYIAMGWEFDNYICEYFQKVKDELKNELPEEYYNYIENIINIIPEKLYLAEEPLSENNIGFILYLYNYNNDPFEVYAEDDEKIYIKKLDF